MSNQQQAQQKRADIRRKLLAQVPKDIERVQVMDEKGKLRWRAIVELVDTDEIQVKKDGSPVVMKGRPGRREIKSKTGPINAVVAKLLEDKQVALDDDPLLQLVKSQPESHEVLHQAMIGLAEEAGSIAFERREAERNGEPTSQLSSRRVNTLKSVVDTWLKRQDQLTGNSVDMDSPAFASVMGFVMETFRGCMVDSQVDEGMIRVVFSRFSKKVATDDWKAEAKNRMKTLGSPKPRTE